MGDAFPYLMPAEDSVRAAAWAARQADGALGPLPEWISTWDISRELLATRRIEINLDEIYRQCGIPSSCRLGLSVVFVSDFEDAIYGTTFDETSGTLQPKIEIRIPGNLLGPAVTLSTSLILRDQAPPSEEPVPWRCGSILWSDLKRVRLYGDGSQFPVTEVDFSDCGLDPAAPWFVEIGPELELPAMGSIQLLLNSRFPLVVAAARGVEGERPELAVVRSQLFADIGRTLVEFALSQDELEDEWPDESLGAVLAAAVSSRFHESVSDLRQLRDQDPSGWAAKTAAAFGLLREPLR